VKLLQSRHHDEQLISLAGGRCPNEVLVNMSGCSLPSTVSLVANVPRSVAPRSCLLGLLELTGALPGPVEAYSGRLMPTVISVSIWLPLSRVLSACYCLLLPRQSLCT